MLLTSNSESISAQELRPAAVRSRVLRTLEFSLPLLVRAASLARYTHATLCYLTGRSGALASVLVFSGPGSGGL